LACFTLGFVRVIALGCPRSFTRFLASRARFLRRFTRFSQ
jgi:hypothetical protein